MAEVKEVVADVAEKASEEATTVAEVSRRLSSRDIRLVLAGAGAGLALGGVIGGFIADKRLRTKYEELAESEIDLMRDHYRAKTVAMEGQKRKPTIEEMEVVVKEAGYTEGEPDPTGAPNTAPEKVVRQSAAIQEAKAMRDDAPVAESPGIKDAVAQHREMEVREVRKNVFEEHSDTQEDWVWEEEMASRTQDKPYVIHLDEQGEKGYNETTLTYYAGDGVVADTDDKHIENPDKLLGDFEDKFGHGSSDPNVVYIRNDKVAADLEICYSPDSYAEVVHGHNPDPDELKHHQYHRRAPFDDE